MAPPGSGPASRVARTAPSKYAFSRSPETRARAASIVNDGWPGRVTDSRGRSNSSVPSSG